MEGVAVGAGTAAVGAGTGAGVAGVATGAGVGSFGATTVSYTHLTLPTNREV